MSTKAPPSSREDNRRRHRRRSRLLMLRRLLVVALVAALAVVLWTNWDTLAPDKLFAQLQDSLDAATGTFPVDISGTRVTALERSQSYITVLSDSYLTYYNTDGGEINRFACTYGSPLLRTAGRYVLVAEQDGKRVQLYTRSSLATEVTAKERILSVAVNTQGQFAVLTRGTQSYAVQVTVYDSTGQQIYARSRTKLATGVALSPDGEYLAVLSVEATGGVISSLVEIFPLAGGETAATFTHSVADTLLYRLDYMNSRYLAAVGETGVLSVDTRSGTSTAYTVENRRVLGSVVNGDGVALAVRDYGDTAGGTVVLLDRQASQRTTVDFDGEFRHLSTDGDDFLLLTDTRAQAIAFSGVKGSALIEADGQRAALAGDTAVILGLNSIQAYELQ